MNNEQRERDGMDSLLKDLGQAAFDANIDEYERIESEIKKAFATLPAPSDWEDELYRLAEKINLSEAFAADDQIEEVIAFVRALTTNTEGEG